VALQFAEKVGYTPASVPSAAEASTENGAFIAAVNRCATQKQKTNIGFLSRLWPLT
jgi:hypothetical protein